MICMCLQFILQIWQKHGLQMIKMLTNNTNAYLYSLMLLIYDLAVFVKTVVVVQHDQFHVNQDKILLC